MNGVIRHCQGVPCLAICATQRCNSRVAFAAEFKDDDHHLSAEPAT
jgi:hypothetical protein